MTADPILLDTTVQLWRIAYGSAEGNRFARELVDKEDVYTTSLVFREFLRTIISDIQYLYLLTSELLTPNRDGSIHLSMLSRFLATGEGNYSSRSIQRLHLVMASLLDGFSATNVPKGKILCRLERTANRWIRDFFRYSDKNGIQHQVLCLTALDEYPDEVEQMRRCRPFPPRPAFPLKALSFLDGRREQVERVIVEMSGETLAKGKDKKLLDFLERLRDRDGTLDFSGRLPRYKEHCWRLGDLLIALEAPEGVCIYSTDRAFLILTHALEKCLYRGYRAPNAPPA